MAKVISAKNIQKTVEWGKDAFGREVMAISELHGESLHQQIVLEDWEQTELLTLLMEALPHETMQGSDPHTPVEEPPVDDDKDPEDDLDDIVGDKYLLIESRMSGGKKKMVLNWCEDVAEALDVLQTIWTKGEISTVKELADKVKIIKYIDVVPLESIWEDNQK